MSSDRPILHIVPSEPWGGIQTLVPMLVREQINQGKSVRLLCLGPGRRIREVANEYGLGEVTRSFAGWSAPLRIMAILLRARGSIIHTHCQPMWASAVIAATLPRRWVAHAHVFPDYEMTWKKRVVLAFQRVFTARQIAISHAVAQALASTHVARAEDIDVVYNGADLVDTKQAPMLAKTQFKVAFVGRVLIEKGILEFVALAARFSGEGDISFEVYGDGPALAEAQSLATKLGVPRIIFHGYVQKMSTAWPTIDVAIVFSRREGFGLVLIEAALNGAATITYENGTGSSEVAAFLKSAHLIPTDDFAIAVPIITELRANPHDTQRAIEEDRITIAARFGIDTMERGVSTSYAKLERCEVPPR